MYSLLSVVSFLHYDFITFIHDQVICLSLNIPLTDACEQEPRNCVFISNDGNQLVAFTLPNVALHLIINMILRNLIHNLKIVRPNNQTMSYFKDKLMLRRQKQQDD